MPAFSPLRSTLLGSGLLSRGQMRVVLAGIAGVHLWAAWVLCHAVAAPQKSLEMAPIFVEMLAPTAVVPTRLAQPPAPSRVSPARAEPRRLPVAAAPAQAALTPEFAVPAPVEAKSTAPVGSLEGQASAASLPSSTAAPVQSHVAVSPPKLIPASAVQYLVPLRVEYPRAAQRRREAGTAIVRVYIDTAGLPQTLQIHRSTGFPLLDEAATAAASRARFKPYSENGQPTAGWALITVDFVL
ncbi:energy transducer TonB [Roseateles koreensis]|uniref:TonB family protein n=1 Tax=Roseateles koreensis TaxID=2987526 RepID=A0ABT5KRB7_9BURK|nr:energy transducer TonB [Roseateles koreensis]MDC8784990.1 TonB family protein [Roseateles koreensis]